MQAYAWYAYYFMFACSTCNQQLLILLQFSSGCNNVLSFSILLHYIHFEEFKPLRNIAKVRLFQALFISSLLYIIYFMRKLYTLYVNKMFKTIYERVVCEPSQWHKLADVTYTNAK